MKNPLKLLGIAGSPVHKATKKVLPKFSEDELGDPAVRRKIVSAADTALIAAQPGAAAIPSGLRRKVIGASLAVILGDAI